MAIAAALSGVLAESGFVLTRGLLDSGHRVEAITEAVRAAEVAAWRAKHGKP